jgi:hypothetical protein
MSPHQGCCLQPMARRQRLRLACHPPWPKRNSSAHVDSFRHNLRDGDAIRSLDVKHLTTFRLVAGHSVSGGKGSSSLATAKLGLGKLVSAAPVAMSPR